MSNLQPDSVSAATTNKPHSITQGSPLPFKVIDDQHANAAYPQQKLEIRNGGFGSDAAAHPTHPNQFYGLTDRGPNADYKGRLGAGKQFLVPSYTPKIGLFEIQADGSISKLKEILLKDTNGNPITGLPNPIALGGTGEIPYGANGEPLTLNPDLPYDEKSNPLKTDINGLDPEGLAALSDGTFWVSDEYGPHLVHFDADGVEIERINPFSDDPRNTVILNNKKIVLPAHLTKRRNNRGMEALDITPDQSTLIGMLESSMDNPDHSGRGSTLTRLITINLHNGQLAQYLYRLDADHHVNSSIIALDDHELYVSEHDRQFPLQKQGVKKLIYKLDLSNATNIEAIMAGEHIDINGPIKQDDDFGLMIGSQTLEQFIAADENNWALLAQMGIYPATKTLVVDVLEQIDFPHDKLEGIWLRYDGSIGLLNDDDFAINDADNQVEQKYLDADKTIEDATRLYAVQPNNC